MNAIGPSEIEPPLLVDDVACIDDRVSVRVDADRSPSAIGGGESGIAVIAAPCGLAV